MFDFYQLIRPLLFAMDPEMAHRLTIKALSLGLGPQNNTNSDPVLRTEVCGLRFANPIGLAAGFDKQAEVMGALFGLGFGAVEVGSITPLPQPGNPQPRLFRVPEAEAVINRFGFNSDGFDACVGRIHRYARERKAGGVFGVNIGKNKESPDAIADYTQGIQLFAPYADYLTINISSPNTPGLRDLQRRDELSNLLVRAVQVKNAAKKQPPLFVKIAPDQTDEQLEDIAAVALSSGIDGVIIGNTTMSRPDVIPPALAAEAGGLSGKPLRDLSTDILRRFYKLTGGRVVLIGCGGIGSGADAYAKIRAGASLIQLYTALIYQGPGLVGQIRRELVQLVRRDGFSSVREAVGADHR